MTSTVQRVKSLDWFKESTESQGWKPDSLPFQPNVTHLK